MARIEFVLASFVVLLGCPRDRASATGDPSMSPVAAASSPASITPSAPTSTATATAASSSSDLQGLGVYDGGSGLLGPSANQQVPSEYLPKSAVEPPNVNVAMGAATATGVATPDAVLAKNQPRYRACARSAAAHNPLIDGKAKLTLTVDAEGSVTDAKVVASSTSTPSLDACFASASRSLKFAGAGTVTFELAIKRP